MTLIGATTENPSFEVIGAAALALPRVHAAARSDADSIAGLLARALARSRARPRRARAARSRPTTLRARSRRRPTATRAARSACSRRRRALAARERPSDRSTRTRCARPPGARCVRHDRDREEHYNVVSAFIKSLRASDPDAALYWVARMLEARRGPALRRAAPRDLRLRGRRQRRARTRCRSRVAA